MSSLAGAESPGGWNGDVYAKGLMEYPRRGHTYMPSIIKFNILLDQTMMQLKNLIPPHFILVKIGSAWKAEGRISILVPDRLLKPHFPAKMLKQLASDG